jgi:hypothetical protein
MTERKAKPESKFAGIFRSVTPPPAADEPPDRIEAEQPAPRSTTARPIGRPPGKRSDPAWKQFSVLLKKQTQREAAMILRTGQDEDDSRDLSGLLQELLERWVEERRRTAPPEGLKS